MDDLVRQAMAKWPHVPHCYGWLGLDARGAWWMRDDPSQALGSFTSGVPGAKGSKLEHEKLIGFIQRNYGVDARGCWYFQNGPQRVYVELQTTPWVWRVSVSANPAGGNSYTLANQTGAVGVVASCLTDETGRVYVDTDGGFGLVHTLDVALAAQAVDEGVWTLESVNAADLPLRFGYVCSPQALHGEGKQLPEAH